MIEKDHEQLAMEAVTLAAYRVWSDAKLHNRALPVWNGQAIDYMVPTDEQLNALRNRALQSGNTELELGF